MLEQKRDRKVERTAQPNGEKGCNRVLGVMVVAKARARKSPIPAAPQLAPQALLVPQGPTEPVDIKSLTEGWSEYTLADGSVIRTKLVILEVKIVKGQYTPEGDPVYFMQLAGVNQLKAADHLKKGG
jgi:hypothetical protein